MKFFLLTLLCLSSVVSQERYSQVEIPVRSAEEYRRIAELGVAADHFTGKIGGSLSLFLSASELQALTDAGIAFRYIIEDWAEFYESRQHSERLLKTALPADAPKNFRYGAMGGFLTYAEVLQQLDSMHLLFPALITTMDSIGASVEGRKIVAVKISDNPAQSEPSEPEVLYTALHHAREPQGLMTVIYYMWWLLENYGTNPEATYLVNNRQMWFIPVVNPDGYVYNQSLNNNGGGMWRKNRRDNGNGSFGVDLNRNYGPHFMWDAPNGGSSTLSNSDVFRGPAPFSEPETFTLSAFLKLHNVRACFNYHTYGNYIIYPWGYSSSESGDSLLFRQWTYDMSMSNRYSIGTDQQTVGYSTRGNSDDFMYGDTSKPRAYSMTPEVGTTGFWPSKTLIYPLAQENIHQNKMLAYFSGAFPAVRSIERKGENIVLRLVNKGLEPLSDMKLYLTSSEGNIIPSVNTGGIAPFEEKEYIVNQTFLSNESASSVFHTVSIKDSTGGLLNDSISFITGNAVVLLNDSAQSTDRWTTGSGWNVAYDAPRDELVFTDSPDGFYKANSDNPLTLRDQIDLAGFQFAELKFNTKWEIESTWDFGIIEVSTNNGSSWTSVKTRFSRKGSGRNGSKQPSSSYGYDAFTPGLSWTEQSADLTPFAGQKILIRFRLSSDGGMELDGWYLDDIRVLAYASSPASAKDRTAPVSYSLSQNFPNPFNPVTTIRFSVDKERHTVLRVYNIVGQEVALLVDKTLTPGTYSVNFDAKWLSSGIYFYRFTSGNFTDIKKMTVVK